MHGVIAFDPATRREKTPTYPVNFSNAYFERFIMYPHQDQLAAATHAHFEASLTLANTAISSTESIAALNLNAGQTVLADMFANMQALAGARDLPEFIVLQAAMLRPAVEKSIAYSRSRYEITLQANDEAARLIETRFADAGKKVIAGLEQVVQSVQVRSRAASEAATSADQGIGKTARSAVRTADADPAAAKKSSRTPTSKPRKVA